ncbi:hypothetical protein D3C86_1694470 [compost metagenome]
MIQIMVVFVGVVIVLRADFHQLLRRLERTDAENLRQVDLGVAGGHQIRRGV